MRELLEAIDRLEHDPIGFDDERKRAELEFHDSWRDGSEHTNDKYYATVGLSRAYVEGWILEHARDRVFLDYACGEGSYARSAASAGARISIGIDISPQSIQKAKAWPAAENLRYFQADCENTRLPAGSIDAVICSGVLHHLDLDRAFAELGRIVRPGGSVLAVEALDHNPVIRAYRHLTPYLRTEWERHHILSLRDVQRAAKFFRIGRIRYWHLFSILTTPFRKWPLFPAALGLGNLLDSIFLNIRPINLMAWMMTFELHKE